MTNENRSTEVMELIKALSAAQGQMKFAQTDADNPFFNSKYANLASVWAALREPLSKNGLAVVQSTSMVETRMYLTTTLFHSSGQWISGICQVISDKNTAQAIGSALTYFRRYGIMAICGVAPSDDQTDDDGNAAGQRGQTTAANKNASPAGPAAAKKPAITSPVSPINKGYEKEALNAAQSARLFTIAGVAKWELQDLRSYMKKKFNLDSTKDLSQAQYDELTAVITSQSFDMAMQNFDVS